jgi:hypothetical protein
MMNDNFSLGSSDIAVLRCNLETDRPSEIPIETGTHVEQSHFGKHAHQHLPFNAVAHEELHVLAEDNVENVLVRGTKWSSWHWTHEAILKLSRW